MRLLAGVLAERDDAARPSPRCAWASSSHSSTSPPERTTSFAPTSALDVAGARLVAVRIGVGREDPGDLGAVARDAAREVGDLGRGRDDGATLLAAAAAGEQGEGEQGEGATSSVEELTEIDSRFHAR